MSTYCTETQVESNLKGVEIGAGTLVSTTDLAEYIEEESSLIDSYVQVKYSLPITDVDGLVFLRRLCIIMCVYRVTKTLQPKNALPVPDDRVSQEISHSSAYSQAIRTLKDIASGKAQLPIVASKSKVLFSSTAVTNDEDFVLKHDEKQW